LKWGICVGPAWSRIKEKKMVKIAEVVTEFSAEGFSNTGKQTRGRVLRDVRAAVYSFQVDDEARGLSTPSGEYTSEEDARAALFEYWDKCEEALKASGTPSWKPKY
jgi:hypothetical protein